jgi:hypothetical protein
VLPRLKGADDYFSVEMALGEVHHAIDILTRKNLLVGIYYFHAEFFRKVLGF